MDLFKCYYVLACWSYFNVIIYSIDGLILMLLCIPPPLVFIWLWVAKYNCEAMLLCLQTLRNFIKTLKIKKTRPIHNSIIVMQLIIRADMLVRRKTTWNKGAGRNEERGGRFWRLRHSRFFKSNKAINLSIEMSLWERLIFHKKLSLLNTVFTLPPFQNALSLPPCMHSWRPA